MTSQILGDRNKYLRAEDIAELSSNSIAVNTSTTTDTLTVNTSSSLAAASASSLTASGNVTADTLNVSTSASIANLTVTGTQTVVNSTNMTISDGMTKLSSGNLADITDCGFYGLYNDGTERYCGFFRQHDTQVTTEDHDGKFHFFKGLTVEPTSNTVDTSDGSYVKADIVVGDTQGTSLSVVNGTANDHLITNATVDSKEMLRVFGREGLILDGRSDAVYLESTAGSLAKFKTTGSDMLTDVNMNSNNITGVNNVSTVSATLTDDLGISKAGEVSVNIQSDNSAYTKYGFGTTVETARFNVGGNSSSFIINDSATGLSGGNNALVFTPTGASDTNLFLYGNGTGSISLNANGSEKVNVNNTQVDITNANLDLHSNTIINCASLNGITSTEINYLDNVSSNIQTQLNSKMADGATATTSTNWDLNVFGNAGYGLVITNTYASGLADSFIACDNVSGGTDSLISCKNGGANWSFGLQGSSDDFVICNANRSLATPKLALDTSGNLTLTGDLNASVPHITLVRDSALSVSNNTQTAMTWTTVDLNNGFSFTPTSSTITVPTDGLYQVNYNIRKDTNASGSHFSWIECSNTTDYSANRRFAQCTYNVTEASAYGNSAVINLAASQTLTLYVYQATGSAINYAGNTEPTKMRIDVTKIGKKI